MAIDPSIILNLQNQKPVDYMGAYGNALTLKNLIGQGRMQDMQLAQAQREQEKQMRLADLVRSSGGDLGKFQQGYMEIDPLGGMELGMKQRKADAEIAKYGAEGRKLALESADKFKPLYLQAAQFVQANGYTPESVQEAKRFLGASGVPGDMLASIPDNPTKQYIDSYIASSMTFSDRLGKDRLEWDQNYPDTLSKLGYARDKYVERWNRDAAEQAPITEGTGTVGPNGELVAPAVVVPPPPDLYGPRIARERFGEAPEGFQYANETGKLKPLEEVQEYKLKKAEKGATVIGVQAYEKELNKQDAQAVSKARDAAEVADRNASEVRTIVDVLRGYKGGQWSVIGAKIGEFLPGTDFAKASNVYQVAESIRNRLAPSMRVAGTGAQSDLETRALMSSIPSLLNYEEGRELLARVFERAADRQAIAADIKDELIRTNKYSGEAYRKALRERFKDGGLLTPDELALVNRARQSPPPEPGQSAPMPKADFNLKSMPDPAKNAGKNLESSDGTRYRSDGKKWIRQGSGASGDF